MLGAIDESYDDDPINSGTDDPEGQITNWSLEFEHGSTYRGGTVGTVTQDGTDGDEYVLPVTGLYTYNGYTLWLKGDNDIESTYGRNIIDPREEFAPDPHESYNRGSVSIPSTPHIRSITVANSTSSSVTFLVSFSETVTGVNATDFKVLENGLPEHSPEESTYSASPNTSVSSSTGVTVSDIIPISGYSDGLVETMTLNVDISHTRVGDIEVELVGPDGTLRKIHDNAGGTTVNLNSSFTPNFAGKAVDGKWTLQVRDNGSAQSSGIINSWSLDFSYEDTPTYEELLLIEADKGTAYTWKDILPGNYNLRVYPDAAVRTTPCATDGIMIDGYNGNTACIANDSGHKLVYTSNAYMRYPVTVEVALANVRMTDPDMSDVPLGYLDGRYEPGNVFFIPLIPGMSTLEMRIAGTDAVVYLADVAEPVQILAIPSARGNPASSGAAMFATTNGHITAYVQVVTDRGADLYTSFDFTARYNHLQTDCNAFKVHQYDPRECYWGENLQAIMQEELISNAASNWASIVTATGGGSTSSTASVTIEVYRNGVLVETESDGTSHSAGNIRARVGTPFTGFAFIFADYDEFDVNKKLSFYAEAGDYIEISITSQSSSSASLGSPPTTPPGQIHAVHPQVAKATWLK